MCFRATGRFLIVGLCTVFGLMAMQPSAAGAANSTAASALTSVSNGSQTAANPSQSSLASATQTGLGAFSVSGDKPQLRVPPLWRPYALVRAVPPGRGTRDATGVPMFAIGTKLYDHPVRQAQDGLLALESFRINKDPRQLAQAKMDAQRLLDRADRRGSGLFFPYPFDFAVHGKAADTIRAPWYSGMAQGLALSLFSRLADTTKNRSWRLAAAGTFESLLLPPDARRPSLPFVSWVDANKHLWIDEYARQPLAESDRTFNGHIFGVFGVWDYHRINRDPRAAKVFAGALETVRYHVSRGWRTPSWISRYCLTHGPLDQKYHQVHVSQMRLLHSITANSGWSVRSDLFRDDYPSPRLAARVSLGAGKRVGYRFDKAGRVLASRGITLTRPSTAPTSTRARIRTRSYYYLITAGSLSGYWVQEKAAAVYVRGLILSTTYPYPRLAGFRAGPHTGWTMTTAGLRAGSRTVRLSRASYATFDRSGWIAGKPYVRVTNGSLAGRWVPTAGLTLR